VGQPSSGIGVVDKSVSILAAVAVGPCTLAELVAATGVPRATAHRLAVALEVHRLVDRDDSLSARESANSHTRFRTHS
jgi:DNA-binding IclR family transcriptional regulator